MPFLSALKRLKNRFQHEALSGHTVCSSVKDMTGLRSAVALAAISLLIYAFCGCVPPGDEVADEQKDMHYQRGRSLSASLDFNGAIYEFEKALEVNPRNASAHFELGCLYEERTKDYVSAIYHYEKHLALQTNSPHIDQAKEHIRVCIRELAKAEYSPPDIQNLRKEIDRLNGENLVLRQQLDFVRTQLVTAVTARDSAIADAKDARAAAQAAQATADSLAQAAKNSQSQLQNNYQNNYTRSAQPYTSSRQATSSSPTYPPGQRPKTHTVRSGETLSSIAQTYNIRSLRSLLAANPKVNPKRLRAGQVINLP
mgnify:CR=1 FL=1